MSRINQKSSYRRKLFATAPNAKDSGDQSQIIVVNIDPEAKPLNSDYSNSQKWQEQIGKVAVDDGAEGITASSTANILTFTNRRNESKGYGVLKVTNDDPLKFAATVNYAQLSLGGFDDYFDVNEAVSITLTKDGKYGFVAGFNGRLFGSGIESIDGVQAGSNIGIIQNPLGNNPILVAATRPIPMGLTTDLTLSPDERYLYASYPGNGGIYVFDVAEITKTLSHPGNYLIDDFGRPLSSPFFNPNKQKPASIFDLGSMPIDDINPNISVAADYGIVEEDQVRNQFTYGPFPDSNRLPVNPGGTPRELITAPIDIVDLNPLGDHLTDTTPTFTWSFDLPKQEIKQVNLFVSTFAEGEGLFPWDEVVDLDKENLAADLTKEEEKELLTEPWHGYDDFNPGRILTATWKQDTNAWYLYDGKTKIAQIEGQPANNSTRLTLPDEFTLTAGQDYHWAVQAITTSGETDTEASQLSTVTPPSTNPFSSVTVITHGFTQDPSKTGIPDSHYDLADQIISASGKQPSEQGLILRYDKSTGDWIPVDQNGRVFQDLQGGLKPGDEDYRQTLAANIVEDYQHKPLVLLSEWSLGRESVIRDSGFTEGAADAIFASLTNFDQAFAVNDGIGDGTGKILDEQTGELIRQQGDLFNSPLHFVGFSRGAVVNSEIIQRLGTFYPNAGGAINADGTPVLDTEGNPIRDLQMTTIDPHDFDQPTLGPFRDFREPKIQVWENVTFADNYYQDLANPNSLGFTPNGRGIPNLTTSETQKKPSPAGLNFPKNQAGQLLGQPDLTVKLNGRKGFEKDYFNPITKETPHGQVFAWYSGTVDLNLDRIEVEGVESPSTTPSGTHDIYDQLGEQNLDSEELKATLPPWYGTEGSREGWFYSVLGGGKELRPQSEVERVPLSFDNTLEARMRGDFAVPTVFNGNYDASFDPDSLFRTAFPKFGSFAIPGWGLHNLPNLNTVDSEDLTEWSKIPGFATYLSQVGYDPEQPNYALKLKGGDKITHNPFVVPDWGSLRFDLHVPNPGSGTVKVFLNDQELKSSAFQGVQKGYPGVTGNEYPAVDLRRFELNKSATDILGQSNRIGFAEQGFQTFQVDIPNEFRGKVATLKFQVEGGQEVYLDNVFFKSQDLLFGSPEKLMDNSSGNYQQARKDVNTPEFKEGYSTRITEDPDTQFGDNYLLEKPQYSLSYNSNLRTPNWVSYQLNKTWLGNYSNSDVTFQNDPRSPFAVKVEDKDIIEDSNYEKGHMSAAADRSRNEQDYKTTYLTSNILPQPTNKSNGDPWTNLEGDLRNFVKNQDGELYIVAGRYGQAVDEFGVPILLPEKVSKKPKDLDPISDIPYKVSVPESVWKVVLVLDKSGQGISDVTKDTLAFAINLDNTLNSNGNAKYPDGDWTRTDITSDGLPTGLINIDKLEEITGYDFLSNIPTDIQEKIEGRKYPNILEGIYQKDLKIRPAPLMASTSWESANIGTFFDSSIGHNSIPNCITATTDHVFGNIDISEVSASQNSTFKSKTRKPRPSEVGTNSVHVPQDSVSQVSFDQATPEQIGRIQLGFPENSTLQTRLFQNSTSEIGTSEIDTTERSFTEIGTTQVNSLKTDSSEISLFNVVGRETNTSEISFSSLISDNQFFSIHNSTPKIINALNNSATKIWSDLLQSQTQLDIDFQITDLPKGQLAEGTITGFDSSGKPNAGTILIDSDANGVGWFIDPTPLENSEFRVRPKGLAPKVASSSENYLLAAAESEASGKYDLMTTVLHELSHLYGFIDGYSGFDSLVAGQREMVKGKGEQSETLNHSPLTFKVGEALSFDGEHLDKQAHPYDLLNTHLAPGMRKLPSELDVEILQAILADNDGETRRRGDGENLEAALTSDPLLAISNGDFSIADTTSNTFAWDTRGASGIENAQAVLTEDSPFQSNFTQTFTVPEAAKTVKFTLVDIDLGNGETGGLGDGENITPPDAFEVALLDANTYESLVSDNDLTATDSLLNIQPDGTAHFSDRVRIGGATSGEIINLDKSRTVTIDISDLTPGTEATLYFDLLGFGDVDSRVVIDDVKLSDQNLLSPVAESDRTTTTQGKPVVIDILANDSDDDGAIATESVQIQTKPSHRTVQVNQDGTVTYTPGVAESYAERNRFTGTDTFSYLVADNDGQQSEEATVTVNVANAAPKITQIQIPDTITEGDEVELTAIASDAGNDDLTYTWDLGSQKSEVRSQKSKVRSFNTLSSIMERIQAV